MTPHISVIENSNGGLDATYSPLTCRDSERAIEAPHAGPLNKPTRNQRRRLQMAYVTCVTDRN